MWCKFTKHHAQQGAVTAVVWGSPSCDVASGTDSAGREDAAGQIADASQAESSPAAATAASSAAGMRSCTGAWKYNAEELTRGRRAETPFIQQCDLVFPLPPPAGDEGSGQEVDVNGRHAEEEKQIEVFVRKQLGEHCFYYRARGPLSALLTQPLLGTCVLQGNFCALAVNAPSDQGNSWAILPGGTLVLSLDRETFQTLGLPGAAARMRPKGNSKRAGAGSGCTGGGLGVAGGGAGGADRFISVFDLSSRTFRPGKALHDRLLACLGAAGGGGKIGGTGGDGGMTEGPAGTPAVAATATATDVEMVMCWWGDNDMGKGSKCEEREGGGSEDGKQGSGVKSESADTSHKSVQGERRAGGDFVGRMAQANIGPTMRACREKGLIRDEKVRGGGVEKKIHREPHQERHLGCGCREVPFPPGLFSVAKKVNLEPDIRFFREVCCPDLDWVGQGLISPPPRISFEGPSAASDNKNGRRQSASADRRGETSAATDAEEGGVRRGMLSVPAEDTQAEPKTETNSMDFVPFREQPPNPMMSGSHSMWSSSTTTGIGESQQSAVEMSSFGGSSADMPKAKAAAAAAAVAEIEKAETTAETAAAKSKISLLMLDLFEWLGAASCGLEAQLRRNPFPPEPYLSEFVTPQHLQYRQSPGATARLGQAGREAGIERGGGQAGGSRSVCRVRLRGLVPPPAVRLLVEAAGAMAAGDNSGGEISDDNGVVVDGCSWGSVTAWPFRDAPRAYAAADASCGGGERGKKKKRRARGDGVGGGGADREGVLRRAVREWPVGGHGVYTVVACPGESATAFVSARCPGPGW